jgi:predicted ATP-grasp superfamily ATP-dependent carboligase
MRALIVSEGRSRAALAAVRALGRAGWDVGVASPARPDLAATSRWARRWHEVPLPEVDAEAFLDAAATASRGYEVVFGCGDAEVLALSAGRDLLGATVGYGPHESVVRALDKLELGRAAGRTGLATPRTVPATPEHLNELEGPIVVKARLHWSPDSKRAPARQVALIAAGRQEASRRAAEILDSGGDPILQELVAGRLLSLTTLIDGDGRPAAQVQQLADRVWPLPMGGAARARTVAVDRDLAERVRRMLADLEWRGLAHVQFLVPDDGPPRLIDLNGRFYGSMALAIAAGPNFPDLWARLATGRPLPKSQAAREGIRFQWLEGDLRRARVERRGGVVPDLLGCLARAPGATHSIWSARDRRPFWDQVRLLARLAFRKALRTSRQAAVPEPIAGTTARTGPA